MTERTRARQHARVRRQRHAREVSANDGVAAPIRVPPLQASSRLRQRLGDGAPLAFSAVLAGSVFVAPLHPLSALAFALLQIAFLGYWVVRSYSVVGGTLVGMRRMRAARARDWRTDYERRRASDAALPRWSWARHLVIIPNYTEDEARLARLLDSLAAQSHPEQLVVVLAMEARETGAEAKAARLIERYATRFGDAFATMHPAGLPGEAPGKGSNEAWAARQAYRRLVVLGGDDLGRYTVTSCDADAIFDAVYFDALTSAFLLHPRRYRRFWQPVILNVNNIWDVPAPLRMIEGFSNLNHVSALVLPGSVTIPTSCYSLSWRMLHEVEYWDEEVIPEDWHLFLKCSYALGDGVGTDAVYLTVGNDCATGDGWVRSMAIHYRQTLRHAWGATDIPYAWRAATSSGPLRAARRGVLAANLTKVHVLWAAQWHLVTLGVTVPALLASRLDAPLPTWWTRRLIEVPAPWLTLAHVFDPARWANPTGVASILETISLNLAGLLLMLCLGPLLVLIALEHRLRGPRPTRVSSRALLGQALSWPFLPVVTLVWNSIPAFHAQWRMAAGRGLVYEVAEKGALPSSRPPEDLPRLAEPSMATVPRAREP